MIEFLKSLFRRDPKKKILAEIERKYKISVELQRNGKLREYGNIMKEIYLLEEEYDKVCKK
tara:strand:- start:457 stop:639 length:183 start_codon:yes stop_codon:yes gene_type:complete